VTLLSRAHRKVAKALGRTTSPHDGRGGRVVAVIHCHLNQNARDAGAACAPAITPGLLELCLQHRTGIVQMPCPEATALGLERQRQPGERIREALDTAHGRAVCRELSLQVTETLQQYLGAGCRVAAIIGGNGESPGCAVHPERAPGSATRLAASSGIFMKELALELALRGLEIPFVAFRDADSALLTADVQTLNDIIGSS
jgi:predicted secreted protein